MEQKVLLLDEKALQEVTVYLQDLPLKYGLPLLNYFNAKIAEQVKNVREEVPQQEEKL